MANVSASPPVFPRGSTVLDYWLAHAEGLTVQPIGARVEEVVVTPRVGRAEALIVRSRMTRRRKEIPAERIAAVEPATGQLMLEPAPRRAPLRIPHPSRDHLAVAGTTALRGGHAARIQVNTATRATRAGTAAAAVWLRPRATQAGTTTARYTRTAAGHTRRGVAWLAPRVGRRARVAAAATVRLALEGALLLARGGALAARELERTVAEAAGSVRALVAAGRARKRVESREH
jgi:hypothetical protein